MKVVVTLQYIMGQLITFCVPLIIIGFIAPSITKLGKNASRLLGVAIVIAYVSSVCAALMSTGAGYALIPHLSIGSIVGNKVEAPALIGNPIDADDAAKGQACVFQLFITDVQQIAVDSYP